MSQIYSKKQIHLIRLIRDKLLRVPLWGTLFISSDLDELTIHEVIPLINKHKIFYKYGFDVDLIDGMKFVRKIPAFDNNSAFIDKHDLKLYDRPNYQVYLDFMHKQMLHYKKVK